MPWESFENSEMIQYPKHLTKWKSRMIDVVIQSVNNNMWCESLMWILNLKNIWILTWGGNREAPSNLASSTLIAFEFLLNKSTWNQYIFNAKFHCKFGQNFAHHCCCSISLVGGFQIPKVWNCLDVLYEIPFNCLNCIYPKPNFIAFHPSFVLSMLQKENVCNIAHLKKCQLFISPLLWSWSSCFFPVDRTQIHLPCKLLMLKQCPGLPVKKFHRVLYHTLVTISMKVLTVFDAFWLFKVQSLCTS